jgi:hypothetical protein
VLEVDSLTEVTVDQLVDALEPENPIQRLGYRKSINIRKYKGFTQPAKQALHKEWSNDDRNPIIGFSHMEYSVCEA